MLTWVVNLGLMDFFSTQRPDPSTYHIDQWNDHGAILYKTPLQSFLLIWAWISGFAFMIIGNTIEDKNWWRKIATRRGKKL